MLQQTTTSPPPRQTHVLRLLGVAPSRWHRPPIDRERKRPGPAPQPIPAEVVTAVVDRAVENPWYGYKRIAVMCRRAGALVTDRQVYRVMKGHDLLPKKRTRKAEIHQTAKLFELLPQGPNDLWQMDVTYVPIPGYGWWYAVTVIDYYSRYLLACHLTSSYSAIDVIHGLKLARAEAERISGPLKKAPFLVTDNGSSFIARRLGAYVKEPFSHVRIQYRTPQQLVLLERFHKTLEDEEVPWRLYDDPQHARKCLAEFRERYNTKRPHWALKPTDGGDVLTPGDVYAEGRTIEIPRWQSWARAAQTKLKEMLTAA